MITKQETFVGIPISKPQIVPNGTYLDLGRGVLGWIGLIPLIDVLGRFIVSEGKLKSMDGKQFFTYEETPSRHGEISVQEGLFFFHTIYKYTPSRQSELLH